jgi:hypothetical protein
MVESMMLDIRNPPSALSSMWMFVREWRDELSTFIPKEKFVTVRFLTVMLLANST